MIPPLAATVLRQIPKEFLVGIATGDYRVLGSVIQSVGSGRIIGHLQETSALISLLGSPPLMLAEMGLQVADVVQNEQIKAAISVVQSLQVASLALGGISIGVSIAGTALLVRRIAKIETKIDAIMPELAAITRGIEVLREKRIAEDFGRLRVLAEQVEEAWLPSATNGEWIDIARESHFLAGSFENRVGQIDAHAGEAFVDAYALASGLRVTARLAAGQDEMARNAAADRVTKLFAFGESVGLGQLALARMSGVADAASASWQERLDTQAESLRDGIVAAQQRVLAAAANAETLEELGRQGIAGRDWLDASREERESPVIVLRAV
jgi:hypothetical protein